ncbi:glycosyltransferase [Microbacterium sp. YMB-B2]|uniref:Glycosyltransferase n=1 Tax=Microbacterium tenebrionis TaxID=2830665 RepID=A0A9X1LP88_9MICO|nr:glycosyltransferase [Microbacterium tenebrionis]MCC2029356.1 glycosyltransferase [Microbacterium tenebrionis]
MVLSGPRICVFPSWLGNPYLNLMSLAPSAAGYEVIGRAAYQSLLSSLAALGSGDVLHIHWTSPIAQSARNSRQAQRRVRDLESALSAARLRGVKVIWTVHNRLPHELMHAASEKRLYEVLADASDVIHVMAPATAELVSDVVTLPAEKIVQIPHPSYLGVYDSGISREEARLSFSLTDDDFAILFLGQIRPYKGIDLLLKAVDETVRSDGRRPILLLAGSANAEAITQYEELRPANVRTITSFQSVPDSDVARWYGAADVAVLPYRAILNSGSLHLAATMNVPAILPGIPHLQEQFGAQPWVSFFDTQRPTESLAELLSEDNRLAALAPDVYDRFNDEISPWTVSLSYLQVLDRIAG